MVYILEKKNQKILRFIFINVVALIVISFSIYFFNNEPEPKVLERKDPVYLDFSNSFDILNDNYYVVVGSNNHNNSDLEKARISVYDSSRTKILEKVYNKGYSSVYNDVLFDGNGYVAVGNYEATKSDVKNGTRTALIVKYDLSGNVIFETDFQVNSNSNYNAVAKVNDGYIVCGKAVNLNTDESGAVLIKYAADGNEVWRRYSGNIYAVYNDVAFYNNYIYVVGVDNGIGILSIFDTDGQLINNVYYNNMDENGFMSLSFYNNYLYLCGGKINNNNNINGLVVRYNLDGTYLNEINYQKYNNVSFDKIINDSLGNVIVIGNSFTNVNDELYSEGVIGKYNFELRELNIVKYSTDRNFSFKDVKVYDNKYAIIGNSKISSENVSSKLFLFSTSLKSMGV